MSPRNWTGVIPAVSHCDKEVTAARKSKRPQNLCWRSAFSSGLRSGNSPGLASCVLFYRVSSFGVEEVGVNWCAGSFVGAVAGSVHEDLVAGVD